MRLRRIEARRFGALCDQELGPLGDGLTVVFGPNEAGKTTLTALVRQVLYGFPKKTTSDRRFDPSDGDAVGSLVFADGRGEWRLQRSVKSNGRASGTVALDGPDGAGDAEQFVAGLVQGLSQETYRSVFGFSLEELSRLETLDDIKGSLFASATGLSTDPHHLLALLREEAEALWSPRANRKTALWALGRELREVRGSLRELREQERASEGKRDELEQARELVPAYEATAREAAVRARSLELTAESWETNALAIEAEDRARAEDAEARTAAAALAARAVPDESLLARADEIDRLVLERSGFVADSERLATLADGQRRSASDRERLLGTLGTGWAGLDLQRLDPGVATEQELGQHADALRDARNDAAAAATRLADAEASLAWRRTAAAEALAAAGIDPALPDAGRAARAGAEQAAAELGAPSAAPAAAARGGAPGWLGWIAIGLGILIAVASAALAQWIGLAAGLALAVVGLLVLVLGRRTGPAAAGAAFPAPLAEATARKAAFDEAVRRCDDVTGPHADVERARTAAEVTAAAASSAEVSWATWARSRGLERDGVIPEPGEARDVLAAAREACRLEAAETELRREAEGLRTATGVFAERVATAAGGGVSAEPEDVTGVLGDLERRLAAARLAAAERETNSARAAELTRSLDAHTAEIERLAAKQAALAAQNGLVPADGVEGIRARAQVAAEEARLAAEEESAARVRAAALEGELGASGGSDSGARLELRQATVVSGISETLQKYVVAALSARLLEQTLETWERDRQPQVLMRARELFGEMTLGAWPGLVSPLGAFSPVVSADDGVSRGTNELSRGTSEQLYLALRIAYLECAVGPANSVLPVLMDDPIVNFDEERRGAAARAIAGLATTRQVVFFTCQEDVARAFSDAAPGHTRLDLARCAS